MEFNSDLLADGIAYAITAWVAYVFFVGSQAGRLYYIEWIGHPTARLLAKALEYGMLLMSGVVVLSISRYEGILYYIGDGILLGFFFRQFIQSDELQRQEYQRQYNKSKHRLVNRMINNLVYHATPQDN